jgi:hypothetical protein
MAVQLSRPFAKPPGRFMQAGATVQTKANKIEKLRVILW